jgi:hypothetical protein
MLSKPTVTNECPGLSENSTSVKKIKLTVKTILMCRFFSYNVLHPYITVFRPIIVIKTWDHIRRTKDLTTFPDLLLHGSYSLEKSIIH